ncbi:MAG: type phosphodiesterase/nucleotide pyrophosphatase [Gemmatimonadetes bacterium]|nr:type phosphodiesterase/nucleotide pyrophosphatase [Gemmatimonadota bacterium]
MSVVILLADGARPDTLDAALTNGALPALARLRAEGGLHTVTSCFPSVTGPAYAPFLMGRFPGPIGLPGLRWFDRAREVCSFPDYSRSYVGYQMGAVDGDIAADAPTIFELAGASIGALNVIGRGLPKTNRIGSITALSAFRAARTHFSGNVAGWLQIDRDVASQITRRVRDDKPEFVFAALTGVDKVSHARGHGSPMIMDALRIVDDAAAEIRADAERAGRWDDMSLWVVSDHGHSRVTQHDDLAGIIDAAGYRSMSHPWVYGIAPEVAVMVSGNAMAHLYLDVRSKERCNPLDARWRNLFDAVLARPSVDLLLLRQPKSVAIITVSRGTAVTWSENGRFHYRRDTGDPLGIGSDVSGASTTEAYEATIDTDYPDGLVQIVHLVMAPRSGEIVLSAARDWDFRSRYEPIPHLSSHGALHREHMLVPLLVNRPAVSTPRRTVDVMPSALVAMGKLVPPGLDGASFL